MSTTNCGSRFFQGLPLPRFRFRGGSMLYKTTIILSSMIFLIVLSQGGLSTRSRLTPRCYFLIEVLQKVTFQLLIKIILAVPSLATNLKGPFYIPGSRQTSTSELRGKPSNSIVSGPFQVLRASLTTLQAHSSRTSSMAFLITFARQVTNSKGGSRSLICRYTP